MSSAFEEFKMLKSVKFRSQCKRDFLRLAILLSTIVGSCLAELNSDPSNENVSDFRTIRYEDLLPGIEQFSDTGVGHFSEILFDFPRYQVIVGARDALYRLSLEGLTKLEKSTWEPSDANIGLCTAKGQSEEDCRNYIKVLVAHNNRIFACGTNAFSPKCSWREIEEINRVVKWVDGRGKCPYSPRANSSALMTDTGDYYIGSSTDFSSNDHAIYRMSGSDFGELLRTVQYNSLWLAQPNFVGSFELNNFIYFVFRETAVEYINCGKAIYSRISRVCKSDKGSSPVLKDNFWTTFLKARLNCSVPGEYPFYFDEIQSMHFLKSESMVYATFTTPENSIPGSAVCSFNMSAVEEAFNGPFKKQSRPDSAWEPVSADHSNFQCKDRPTQPHLDVNSREYQLVDKAVSSSTNAPLYFEKLARFTHIVVESVETKYQEDFKVHVLFVATRGGQIKKLSFNTRNKETCLVEILNPFASGRSTLLNLQLLQATSSIYLATEENVIRIPTQRCRRFVTKRDCLNAMDPYCGWNKQKNECTSTPNKNPRAAYWQQNMYSCPVLNEPVDGSWSPWSDWFQCDYNNPDRRIESSGDYCVCRKRKCDNPEPVNGGSSCDGRDLEVTNCTQHGQWTAWSDWSACSKSCDLAVQQRRRTCGNPAPAFGGRVCVGQDVDSQFCEHLPNCPKTSAALVMETPLATANGLRFSPWSEWSDCSSECGKGFRSRKRVCTGGDGCSDLCTKEYSDCEASACSDVMEVTDFSPWIRINDSNPVGSWSEKRFRFTYNAPASNALAVNTYAGKIIAEDRFCRSEGQCSTTAVKNPQDAAQDEDWTDWSKCTRECGGGYQIRVKSCNPSDPRCIGSSTIAQRECNTQPCKGEWGCWSTWSHCDRYNKKKRTRVCIGNNGVLSGDKINPQCAAGSAFEETDCDGWGPWTDWKDECENSEGTRIRTRACIAEECSGSDKEIKSCSDSSVPAVSVSAQMPVNVVIGACICGFIVGAGLGAGLVYYYLRYRRPGANGGSPHYVSAKSQNLYVSLPMLDLKHKHLSSNQSDCGTLRSTSTLRSKAGGSSIYSTAGKHSDYETATIKRSHSQRNSSLIVGAMRADLDSDQLFT